MAQRFFLIVWVFQSDKKKVLIRHLPLHEFGKFFLHMEPQLPHGEIRSIPSLTRVQNVLCVELVLANISRPSPSSSTCHKEVAGIHY